MNDRRIWSQEVQNTNQEDQIIKNLVKQYGIKKWSHIAQKMANQHNMPLRTGKQCRERWHNHLDPQIKKQEWSKQQQQQLFQLQKKYGHKWSLIANQIRGRQLYKKSFLLYNEKSSPLDQQINKGNKQEREGQMQNSETIIYFEDYSNIETL